MPLKNISLFDYIVKYSKLYNHSESAVVGKWLCLKNFHQRHIEIKRKQPKIRVNLVFFNKHDDVFE